MCSEVLSILSEGTKKCVNSILGYLKFALNSPTIFHARVFVTYELYQASGTLSLLGKCILLATNELLAEIRWSFLCEPP